MKSSAAIRSQIEHALSSRHPATLSPRPYVVRPRVACGVGALDELLQGGLPVGAITELVGRPCSGRSAAALAYVAALAQAGSVCAWIDVADALDPESAAACGVNLDRMLWVRCGSKKQVPSPIAENEVAEQELGAAANAVDARHMGGGSPHPRSEARGMPQAVAALLAAEHADGKPPAMRRKRIVGTPGAPNRTLSHRSQQREEQPNSDRLPPRRGDNLALAPRCAEPVAGRTTSPHAAPRLAAPARRKVAATPGKPWPVLDQALRAADLLLQSAGFSAIVLDLGSTTPDAAWRIPMATWFRFRAACERTRTSLVLLTQHPCARSSAELVVRMEAGRLEVEGNVMSAIRYRAERERSRTPEAESRVVSIRKEPQRACHWTSGATWA